MRRDDRVRLSSVSHSDADRESRVPDVDIRLALAEITVPASGIADSDEMGMLGLGGRREEADEVALVEDDAE